MTTRAHLADGSTFDIDENTEAKFTHLNGQRVVGWEYTGPTPEGFGRDENGQPVIKEGESHADRKARLKAELDALEA